MYTEGFEIHMYEHGNYIEYIHVMYALHVDGSTGNVGLKNNMSLNAVVLAHRFYSIVNTRLTCKLHAYTCTCSPEKSKYIILKITYM